MNNWKIGTRIAAGFAVVIVIAATLGIFAYARVGSIEGSSNRSHQESLPRHVPRRPDSENAELSMQSSWWLRACQHRPTKRKWHELEAEIQAIRARATGVIAEYRNLIVSDKGARHSRDVHIGSRATLLPPSMDEMLKASRTERRKRSSGDG